jgi:hypothetical protein
MRDAPGVEPTRTRTIIRSHDASASELFKVFNQVLRQHEGHLTASDASLSLQSA